MSKLIQKQIKFFKEGGKGLGAEKVLSYLYGLNYKNMDEKKKKRLIKNYNLNYKIYDKKYEDKKTSEYNKVFENPRTLDTNDNFNLTHNTTDPSYYGPNLRESESKNVNLLENKDEPQDEYLNRLIDIIEQNPVIAFNKFDSAMNNVHTYSPTYNVKDSNNEYYESLINKANDNYGTNFKTRQDVAAFQQLMGASKIDGIIGPETEALLAFYYPSKQQHVNNRRMYKAQTNDQVFNRTANMMTFNQETVPDEYKTLDFSKTNRNNYNGVYRDYKDYNFEPMYLQYWDNYIHPYTRYKKNVIDNSIINSVDTPMNISINDTYFNA